MKKFQDLAIDEIVNIRDVSKSDTEIETYGSKEKLNFPQDYEDGVMLSWMI